MEASEKAITLFSTRIRQMILRFNEMKAENQELFTMVDERDNKIKQLEKQLTEARNDYNTLKMAKMIVISDGDMEESKKRLSKLIRDVNKCITLLNEK